MNACLIASPGGAKKCRGVAFENGRGPATAPMGAAANKGRANAQGEKLWRKNSFLPAPSRTHSASGDQKDAHSAPPVMRHMASGVRFVRNTAALKLHRLRRRPTYSTRPPCNTWRHGRVPRSPIFRHLNAGTTRPAALVRFAASCKRGCANTQRHRDAAQRGVARQGHRGIHQHHPATGRPPPRTGSYPRQQADLGNRRISRGLVPAWPPARVFLNASSRVTMASPAARAGSHQYR